MRESYRFINPFAKNNCTKCNITNNDLDAGTILQCL